MDDTLTPSRCAVLRGGAAVAAGSVADAAAANGSPVSKITKLWDWAGDTGAGADETPYGLPTRFEQHVLRRSVEWLKASPINAINVTPIHAPEGTINSPRLRA